MKTNYITKQKYMNAAPNWTIDGDVTGRAVSDSHYMPENGEVTHDRRRDDGYIDDGINRNLLWAVLLGCAFVGLGVIMYFILR